MIHRIESSSPSDDIPLGPKENSSDGLSPFRRLHQMPKVCLNKCFVVHLSVLGTPSIPDITLKFVYSLDYFVDLKNPIKSYPVGVGVGAQYFGVLGPEESFSKQLS